MASVKPMLWTSHKSKDDTYPIVIKIEHGGRRRLLNIDRKIKKEFWEKDRVSSKHGDSLIINSVIASKEAEIKRYLADCALHGKPIHLDLIGTGRTSYSFSEYLEHRAQQYGQSGQPVMRKKLERFARELVLAFGRPVYFEDINPDSLRELERWQISQQNQQNTRAKKFKMLSELYGQAIKEGKAPDPNPFKSHKIALKPVKKDKMSPADIKALENLRLAPGPINDARNLFLFSYYLKGTRFGNCIMVRWADVRDGRVFVKTSKGGKYVSTKIHIRLQAIINQYPAGEFIFPYVDHEPTDPEEYLNLIASRNTIVNRNLKVVAALAEIKPFSFHLARHAFAYQLKQKTDNIHVIKESLGHSDYRTTEIYLKALDDESLDKEVAKLYGR